MVGNMGTKMERLSYTDLDKHWDQNLELRKFIMMESQMGMLLEILRVHHWESHLVQTMEMR